jgi:hypothetical protein
MDWRTEKTMDSGQFSCQMQQQVNCLIIYLPSGKHSDYQKKSYRNHASVL